MISVFFGPDEGLSEAKAKKDIKDSHNGQLPDDLIKYDGYKDAVGDLVADCQSLPLFGGKKTILVTNAYYLIETPKTQKGSLKESEQDYPSLLSYIKSPSDDTDLYFVAPGNLASKSELVVALKENGAILTNCLLMTSDDYLAICYSVAKSQNKTIDKDAAYLLINRSQNDYLLFRNSLDKVLAYADHIDLKAVDTLMVKPLEDNVFDIVSSLVKGDTDKALSTYSDLRKGATLALAILPAMVSQFRFMALVRCLIEKGEDDLSIASDLSGRGVKVNPKRLYYTRKETRNISYSTFIRILTDLGEIEENVKLSQDDSDDRMELFLTLFNKKYL
ncbi:MAG: DNA polymerase III subunit delta [Bacilli bacterium]